MPPEWKIFRKVRKFRPVARFGFRDPTKNFIELIDLFESFEHGRGLGALDPMQASIVVATFHYCGAKLCGQKSLKKGDVLVHQLFLQVFRSG